MEHFLFSGGYLSHYETNKQNKNNVDNFNFITLNNPFIVLSLIIKFWILSVCQRSVAHLPLQLLSSDGAQQRLAAWIEHRISAQFSWLASCWGSQSLIQPVEEGDDEEGETKLQFCKQALKNQPQQHFEQSNVGDDKLSWGQPSAQSAVQQPVTAVLQENIRQGQHTAHDGSQNQSENVTWRAGAIENKGKQLQMN